VTEAWLETSDHELTTRNTYEGYIKGKILPALGTVPIRKVDVETLDRFYIELRKRGGRGGRPLAPSTVRQIHFILRASLGLAVKGDWIPDNPAERATVPKYIHTDVAPPSPEDVTRFLEAAWQRDPDFGTLLWLAMITGVRRAELCGRALASRVPRRPLSDRRPAASSTAAATSARRTPRPIKPAASPSTTSPPLCSPNTASAAMNARPFATPRSAPRNSCSPCVRRRGPLVPDSVTNRIKRLYDRLGIRVTLRGLRHYAATQLLTGGVDLRTVASRLGHAGGGATTLKVYTHFMPTPDHQAQNYSRGESHVLVKEHGPSGRQWRLMLGCIHYGIRGVLGA